jgi:hypothetical protein
MVLAKGHFQENTTSESVQFNELFLSSYIQRTAEILRPPKAAGRDIHNISLLASTLTRFASLGVRLLKVGLLTN